MTRDSQWSKFIAIWSDNPSPQYPGSESALQHMATGQDPLPLQRRHMASINTFEPLLLGVSQCSGEGFPIPRRSKIQRADEIISFIQDSH